MPGLINLLQEVLESSKRNIKVVETLISLLEKDVSLEDNVFTYKQQNNDFREDNLDWSISTDEYVWNEDEDKKLMECDEHPKKQDIEQPLITPLLKLSPSEQEALLYSIFQEAKSNVKTLIGLQEDSAFFETEVEKEADRLLQSWMKSN